MITLEGVRVLAEDREERKGGVEEKLTRNSVVKTLLSRNMSHFDLLVVECAR